MKSVNCKEFCRALERQGWQCVRIRSSHHRYEKSGHSPVTVPVHANRPLKNGLLHRLLKDTGLTEDDL
jgi:predicted RNA binding protein YcfA (HicA-like mRNA interferase family)